MSRKHAKVLSIIIAVVMAASLLLTGCGKSTEPAVGSTAGSTTVAPTEKVKLTFWHTYGDAEDPFLTTIVLPMFKSKYPNIEIESIRQAGDFNQLITTALGTGETPDVARIDITQIANYASQDGIINLEDQEGFTDLKDQCLESPMSTNLYKGKYYGMPLDTSCKAAVMNMDAMKKLGFKEPPKTMEEFIAASKAKSPGKYTLDVSGAGDWDTFAYFTLFGGVVADPTYTKVTGFMDSPQSIAALQTMLDLHTEKVFTMKDVDGTPDAWAEIVKKDSYAMFIEGPWFFSCIPTYKSNNITPAPIPTFNGKSSSIVGGEDIAIFKNCKHPKEAFEFVKFMLSEEVQLLMASKGQYPILKSAVESDMIKKDPIASVYQNQMESAILRIPSSQNTTITQIWSDQITNAFKGTCTAEVALKAAAAAIDVELAK